MYFFSLIRTNLTSIRACPDVYMSRKVLLLVYNAGGHNISLELKHKLTNVQKRFTIESYWSNIY